MKAKTPEEQILAAIEGLSRRLAHVETTMNELIAAQVEVAGLTETLIEAIQKAPQVLLGGVPVETPPDLDLNTWIEAEKKRRGD